MPGDPLQALEREVSLAPLNGAHVGQLDTWCAVADAPADETLLAPSASLARVRTLPAEKLEGSSYWKIPLASVLTFEERQAEGDRIAAEWSRDLDAMGAPSPDDHESQRHGELRGVGPEWLSTLRETVLELDLVPRRDNHGPGSVLRVL